MYSFIDYNISIWLSRLRNCKFERRYLDFGANQANIHRSGKNLLITFTVPFIVSLLIYGFNGFNCCVPFFGAKMKNPQIKCTVLAAYSILIIKTQNIIKVLL